MGRTGVRPQHMHQEDLGQMLKDKRPARLVRLNLVDEKGRDIPEQPSVSVVCFHKHGRGKG
ncbi:hypothetical protein GCM10027416_19230 [Okibacterium endophyticum]